MQDDSNFIQGIFCMVFVLIVFFIVPLWLTAATPEDIAKCQKATGWSSERCEFEINR